LLQNKAAPISAKRVWNEDSRLGRPPRPSQPGSLQGSPQKGVFLAAETRNVQASPPAVKSKFLLVDREDSAPLRTVGGASGTRPALGEGLGCGLRLRASGTGGAVAPRARRGICSTVNCTLDGHRQHRFQPLWCPERPCWRLRPPSRRAGAQQPRRADQAPARGDNSAAFRLEWPPPARHTPATSKKQMPISHSERRLCVRCVGVPVYRGRRRNSPRRQHSETPTDASRVISSGRDRRQDVPANAQFLPAIRAECSKRGNEWLT